MTTLAVRWITILSVVALVAACTGPGTSTAPSASTATAVPVLTAEPSAPPTASPKPAVQAGEPWIAMQTETTSYGVHFVRPDGTDLHRWAAAIPGTQEHPDWSPDGEWVLVNAVDAVTSIEDLWLARADGSDERRLVDCEAPCIWADEPSWSPDGSWVIFQRLASKAGGGVVSTLERVDVESGATSVLLTMPAMHIVLAPRFSSDGKRVTVEVLRFPADSFVVDPEGGAIGVVDLGSAEPEVTYLTEFTSWANNPDWSPTEDVIVYSQLTAPGSDTSDLHAIAADGTGHRQLTDVGATGGQAYHPSHTPDGSHVLFVLYDPTTGTDGVASIAIDGTDLRPAVGDTYLGGMHPRLRPG